MMIKVTNYPFVGALLVAASGIVGAACSSDSAETSSSSVAPLLTDVNYGAVGGAATDNDLPAKTVILTFDDGPDGPPGSATADMTLAIARYLSDQGISATFFVNGRRFIGQQPTSACPLYDSGGVAGVGHASGPFKQYDESVLDTLVQLGHRIANHTQDHCNLGSNTSFVDAELLPTQTILDRHALNGPYLFRPPYGAWANAANAHADACLDKLEGPVAWDVDAGDWGCWSPQYRPNDSSPWPSSGGVSACLQGYMGVLAGRARKNGIFLHHDRPEPAVATVDMYGSNLQGANHYAPQSVTITNDSGTPVTLPGAYPSNELGLIMAEVTYLKSQGYSFGRIEDLYSGRRARNWSSSASCANTQSTATLDYADGDTGGLSGSFDAAPSYYRSFHLADVNGDSLDDACARVGGGIACATNRGNGQFNARTTWFNSNFLDSQGWNGAPYGSTIQFADVDLDGNADVCGRGGAGIYCATSNGTNGFGNLVLATSGIDFSDNGPWANAESYYGSIHIADVNGDRWPDVCGRAPEGIVCALNAVSNGPPQFGPASVWMGSDFTDAVGWNPPQYGATVQLGDINGDGLADVCGRGGAGMLCSLATYNGNFAPPTWWTTWPDFSDDDTGANGWQAPGYYKSIRLADVNQDGRADVCGRSPAGIVCALSTGSSFQRYQAMSYARETTSGTVVQTGGNDFTDALGWAPDPYGSTIQFGRLDYGTVGVCGRAGAGLLCSSQ